MDPILFDWDGTLADTLGAIYAANVTVMDELGLPFDLVRYRSSFTADWRRMYERLGVPDDRLEEANARWWAALDEGETRLFPRVREVLGRLAATGRPLGLVTAGNSERVRPELRRHDLEGFFAVVVCGDDLPVQKPDPAPLRLALGAFGLDGGAERSTYVGDTPDDMRMAVAAGAAPVGIVSLLGDEAELRAAGAREVAVGVAAWVDRLLAPDPSASRRVAGRPVGAGPAG